MPLFGKSRTFSFHPGYSFSGSESWRYVLLFECWGTSRHFCLNECHTDYSSLRDLVFSGATLRERTARKQRPMQRTGQTVIIYTGWHRKGKQRRGKCKHAIHTAALVQCSAYCVFYDRMYDMSLARSRIQTDADVPFLSASSSLLLSLLH